MAERLLGYSVETGFEEGLKRTVEWYKRSAGA
jgi:nucleoside-diphosphate-sugar epimerase